MTLALGSVPSAVAACSTDTGEATWSSQVGVVTQNVLHGNAWPADTDHCRVADRLPLLVRQLDRSCPSLEGLQEMNQPMLPTLRSLLPSTCAGRYRVLADDDPGLDREVVLTTEKVLGTQRFRLAGRCARRGGLVEHPPGVLLRRPTLRPGDPPTAL